MCNFVPAFCGWFHFNLIMENQIENKDDAKIRKPVKSFTERKKKN